MKLYVFQAVLSNREHPEYGVATIPFPIPREEYAHCIQLLEPLRIGDVKAQDCCIDSIDSNWSVLRRLEHTQANVDELDYLAKRIESFWGEDAQFQGMAETLSLSEVADFINLTFCCQQATVITDFADLNKIGKDHYMNLHGGSASVEEIDNLDGEETALLLIRDNPATITPYGVVYDNGFKMEHLYTGEQFPSYLYDADVVGEVHFKSKSDPEGNASVAVILPTSPLYLERALQRGGIAGIDDAVISETDWLYYDKYLSSMSFAGVNPETLNDMCAAIGALEGDARKKLCAALEFVKPETAFKIKNLAQQLDEFEFVPDIATPREYGEYMIQESGRFEFDENLAEYYDYEGYAKQHFSEIASQFTEYGFIGYAGEMSIEELISEEISQDNGSKNPAQSYFTL